MNQANNSPFKFLAPYEARDAEVFFGRNTEIDQLYEMLLATNLVLLYGPSGTGKTSLIQCGLSTKYNSPDWLPLLIRKGESINTSLLSTLENISPTKGLSDIADNIIQIYNTYYRPVYLIFDQFEEVFTLSKEAQVDKEGKLIELITLFQTINTILLNTLPCKVIFIMREEFIGQLYDYEQYLPNIFDFRLRVEPMNKAKVDLVLTGSFNHFNIVSTPTSLSKTISNKLLEGNATSQLAYLQVYLDRLWKEADQENQWTDDNPAQLEIREENLNTVGSIENVLDKYLEEQEQAIETKLNLPVGKQYIRAILDNFVTDDGTKRPIENKSEKLNPKKILTKKQLDDCLGALETARLIRKDGKYYELAHDALAGIIDKKRTGVQLLIKNLKVNINFSKERKARLDDIIIKNYDEVKKSADFEEDVIMYVEESKTYRRNIRFFYRGLQLAIIIVLGLFVYFYFDAKNAKEKAEQEATNAKNALNLQKQAEAKKEIADYNVILKKVNDILDNGVNCPDPSMVKSMQDMRNKCDTAAVFKQDTGFVNAVRSTMDKYNRSYCK